MLTGKAGARHIERVEDAVQKALMAALTTWPASGRPDDPGGWLYRVAWNELMGDLRKQGGRDRILAGASADPAFSGPEVAAAEARYAGEVPDDLLRMLFLGCDEDIPPESRLVFALKILCGFSTSEIALRLFTSEANVQKRLERARDRLRSSFPGMETPPLETLRARLPGVLEVLYLLFNEGYLSAQADQAIRRELCEEGIRLATLLAVHPVGDAPETFALLALMHLHAARLEARQDGAGGLLLLEEQDRNRWDREQIAIGLGYLAESARGEVFSRYHAEAGIAAEHCRAPSFRETRWKEIAGLYALLEKARPSPLHALNRAVATAEWQGPEAGLAILADLSPPPWLSGSYLWDAVLADLKRRAGHADEARAHMERALEAAPTPAIRDLLKRRLAREDR